MSFSQMFPATTWLWRRLSSRWACRVYLGSLAIIIIPAVGLRLESAIYEARVLKVVSALSTMRVGMTSRDEVQARIPALKRVMETDEGSPCPADECLSTEIPGSKLSDSVLLRIAGTGNRNLYSILSWWGFRVWAFDGYVHLASDKVSAFGYGMIIGTPDLDGPNAVVIRVSSKQHVERRNRSAGTSESFDYSVDTSRRRPTQSVGVRFTPNARTDLIRDAFDLRLRCLWLQGCRTWTQILPAVEDIE
ncbi:MAG TPA: hypothetical protein VEF05_14550 [Terriglobales bacterium]|nr:hypothetical protein [Terriglobales bacterium]